MSFKKKKGVHKLSKLVQKITKLIKMAAKK